MKLITQRSSQPKVNFFYFLKAIDRFIFAIARIIRKTVSWMVSLIEDIPLIVNLACCDKELSSYPQQLRKKRLCILYELLLWRLKHNEINKYYYKYLFDRKLNPIKQSEYISYKAYAALRDENNSGLIIKNMKLSYICILRDKYLFYNFIKGLCLPTPEIAAIYSNKSLKWLETQKTDNINDLLQYEGLELFCKNMFGEIGFDILHIKVNNSCLYINGEQSTIDKFVQMVPYASILQNRIKQHPRMSLLNHTCVNTIRIGTFNTGNEIVIFNAILKLGASGNVCDNWHFGGIIVGIDLNTGQLMPYGIGPVKCAEKIPKHPNSDICFEGYEIPYFKQALDLVRRLHNELYGLCSIGWDVAIGEEGPIVIEGNDNWDFRMFQVYYGGYKKYITEQYKTFNLGN